MSKQIVSAAPGGGSLPYDEYLNKLFVVEPLEVEHGIKTDYGEKDAVRANVWVLVKKGTTEEFEDTLIFPKVLQSQTRRKIGSYVVGRLTQGEAKKGQKPPWKLAEATAADLKKASEFLSQMAVTSAADDDSDDDGFGGADDDDDEAY